MPQITNTIVDVAGNPIQNTKITVSLIGNWYIGGNLEAIPSNDYSVTTYTDSNGTWTVTIPAQSSYNGTTYYEAREPNNTTWNFTVADSPSIQRLRDRLTVPIPSPPDGPIKLDDLADVTSLSPAPGAFLAYNNIDNTWEPLTVVPGGSNFYVHNQTSPASTWIITHNLNRYPSVTLFDSTHTLFITDIIYSSLNTVTVVNSGPIIGTAVLE